MFYVKNIRVKKTEHVAKRKKNSTQVILSFYVRQ